MSVGYYTSCRAGLLLFIRLPVRYVQHSSSSCCKQQLSVIILSCSIQLHLMIRNLLLISECRVRDYDVVE